MAGCQSINYFVIVNCSDLSGITHKELRGLALECYIKSTSVDDVFIQFNFERKQDAKSFADTLKRCGNDIYTSF